ncbi:hypothetical protein CEXT_657121 [Caerostris extrusa]|uniref:Uncharacterized protein n=1 Tax=Caerostris extrusa TaxID=172846 RepID=A0AAV4MUL2_CAEEX|nr:hypothetical protein CEXT_657121 [Caerostris extrusa]
MQASFLKLLPSKFRTKSLFSASEAAIVPVTFDEFHAQLMFPVHGPVRSRKNKHAGISSNIRRVFRIMQHAAGEFISLLHDDSETLFSEPLPSQWNLLGAPHRR